MYTMGLLSFTGYFVGCSEKEDASFTQNDEVNSDEVSEATFQFSIAILADPHITGDPEHSSRLLEAIDWINTHKDSRQIELVPVLGDVGWGAGLPDAKTLLDNLEVTYLPMIGDNEIQRGDEERFTTVFSEQFQWLSENSSEWIYGGASVWNPEEAKESHFTNFALTHKGVRLMALDWASRLPISEGIWTEFGYLHDFEGGTLPFLRSELQGLSEMKDNSALLLTHIPMSIGSFTEDRMNQFAAELDTYIDKTYANFAGHLHVNVDELNPERGYDVYVTDATWDDVITLRILDVYQNEESVYYEQELIEFAWSGE